MSVGDIHSSDKGGGIRHNTGKPDFSMIPLHLLEDCCKVFSDGVESGRYEKWNWAKGMAWSIPYACILRHLGEWFRGEEIDQDSGLPHLAHVMCNVLMLTLYSQTYKDGDDRPPKELFNANET